MRISVREIWLARMLQEPIFAPTKSLTELRSRTNRLRFRVFGYFGIIDSVQTSMLL